MGGAATRFTPNPGSWFAHQQDEHGTGVEVYPAGTQLRPAGPEGAGFAMTEPIQPGYSATHFALSVPMSQDQIAAIAEREDWQCYCCEPGAGGFHVMEVWIENTSRPLNAEALTQERFVADQLWIRMLRIAVPISTFSAAC